MIYAKERANLANGLTARAVLIVRCCLPRANSLIPSADETLVWSRKTHRLQINHHGILPRTRMFGEGAETARHSQVLADDHSV
jgi:hypothetical protein